MQGLLQIQFIDFQFSSVQTTLLVPGGQFSSSSSGIEKHKQQPWHNNEQQDDKQEYTNMQISTYPQGAKAQGVYDPSVL